MKIYVEKVVKHVIADRQNGPGTPTGKVGTAIEVMLYAVSESEADAAAWESAVGKTLSVYEGDLVPDDWFVRCPVTWAPSDGRPPERCCFPSLDSPQWHLHDDEHASAHYGWGITEVRARKEELASG